MVCNNNNNPDGKRGWGKFNGPNDEIKHAWIHWAIPSTHPIQSNPSQSQCGRDWHNGILTHQARFLRDPKNHTALLNINKSHQSACKSRLQHTNIIVIIIIIFLDGLDIAFLLCCKFEVVKLSRLFPSSYNNSGVNRKAMKSQDDILQFWPPSWSSASQVCLPGRWWLGSWDFHGFEISNGPALIQTLSSQKI